MKEIVDEVERWRSQGEQIAVATVVATRKSAPRPVGAKFAVSQTGAMCGSVSGGCVENDVAVQALEVIASRRAAAPELRDHRRTGARSRAPVRRRDRRLSRAPRLTLTEALLEVAHGDERAVLFTVIEGERRSARKLLVRLDRGEVVGDGPLELAALAADLRRSGIVELAGLGCSPRCSGRRRGCRRRRRRHGRGALCAAARALGWHTVCVDARARFATPRPGPERRGDRRRMARRGVRADRARIATRPWSC